MLRFWKVTLANPKIIIIYVLYLLYKIIIIIYYSNKLVDHLPFLHDHWFLVLMLDCFLLLSFSFSKTM